MNGKLIKKFLQYQAAACRMKERIRKGMSDNRGEITVSTIIWVIIVVVVLLVIVYAFVSGWISDLLGTMRDTTDAKLEPVIN